jgi:hypothetical protein
MRLKNLEDYIENPAPVDGLKIVQIFSDERYNFFVLMNNGRVFKKRARGQSGAYDSWREVDIVGEISQDLFAKD